MGYHLPAEAQFWVASKSGPDTLSYNEAMAAHDSEQFKEAALKEIESLRKQKTWIAQKKSEVQEELKGTNKRILPGTWAFKRK